MALRDPPYFAGLEFIRVGFFRSSFLSWFHGGDIHPLSLAHLAMSQPRGPPPSARGSRPALSGANYVCDLAAQSTAYLATGTALWLSLQAPRATGVWRSGLFLSWTVAIASHLLRLVGGLQCWKCLVWGKSVTPK